MPRLLFNGLTWGVPFGVIFTMDFILASFLMDAALALRAANGPDNTPHRSRLPSGPRPPLRVEFIALARKNNPDTLVECPACAASLPARQLIQHHDEVHAPPLTSRAFKTLRTLCRACALPLTATWIAAMVIGAPDGHTLGTPDDVWVIVVLFLMIGFLISHNRVVRTHPGCFDNQAHDNPPPSGCTRSGTETVKRHLGTGSRAHLP